MPVTSKPVNLDGWNFSCGLLRHTGTHTMHSHTHLHSCNTHTHSRTHTHSQSSNVCNFKTPQLRWLKFFSCGVLRHTGTHTVHWHRLLRPTGTHKVHSHTFAVTHLCTHPPTHRAPISVTSKPFNLRWLKFFMWTTEVYRHTYSALTHIFSLMHLCTHTHSFSDTHRLSLNVYTQNAKHWKGSKGANKIFKKEKRWNMFQKRGVRTPFCSIFFLLPKPKMIRKLWNTK